MISNFDVIKLKTLLQHFYTLTNIRITVFDDSFVEIVSYPPEISRFCSIIRSDSKALENCMLCDKTACQNVRKTQKFQIYQCHAGLTEVIAPIFLNKIIIGYLIMGHISPYPDLEKGWLNIVECCKNYSLDMVALKSGFVERNYITEDYILAASEIMNSVASYVCISHMATLRNDSIIMQIDNYIYDHLTEELSASVLCEHFLISRSKLYQISEQNYGIGISEYIKNQRIQKAKDLLTQTDLPINLIADSVGISDYNYFSKVFKKSTGSTPKEYRNSK